ncbi:MAG: hypothetical protein EOO93_19630 [Pedobacter sp.]|nr:MAG: hypothetical protein EOO93_19630 [Pedobacter sp.]
MQIDYKSAVLAAYQKRKELGDISQNLINVTPASVRNQCLLICCDGSLDKRDEEILRVYFKQPTPERGWLHYIKNSQAEKYKQIPKILRDEVSKPGNGHMEFVAWLTDFKPRPSTSYYKSFYSYTDVVTQEVNIISPLIQNPIVDVLEPGLKNTDVGIIKGDNKDKQDQILELSKKKKGLQIKLC